MRSRRITYEKATTEANSLRSKWQNSITFNVYNIYMWREQRRVSRSMDRSTAKKKRSAIVSFSTRKQTEAAKLQLYIYRSTRTFPTVPTGRRSLCPQAIKWTVPIAWSLGSKRLRWAHVINLSPDPLLRIPCNRFCCRPTTSTVVQLILREVYGHNS